MTETLDLDHFDEDAAREPDGRFEPEERCSMCGGDAIRFPGNYGKLVCQACSLEAKLPKARFTAGADDTLRPKKPRRTALGIVPPPDFMADEPDPFE